MSTTLISDIKNSDLFINDNLCGEPFSSVVDRLPSKTLAESSYKRLDTGDSSTEY